MVMSSVVSISFDEAATSYSATDSVLQRAGVRSIRAASGASMQVEMKRAASMCQRSVACN